MTRQEEIVKHGNNLKMLFNLDKNIDSLKLCKALLRLEHKAHDITLRDCNGEQHKTDEQEAEEILNRVDKILNFRKQNIKVFINYDARGYALKVKEENLKPEIAFYRDWGGFGIIAPTFEK